MKLYVAYFWTSRNRYSDARAQLEEQKMEIARHVSYNHGRIAGECLAGEYTEEDVSWRCDWPKLAEAIAHASRWGKASHRKAGPLVKNAGFTRCSTSQALSSCAATSILRRETIHNCRQLAERRAGTLSPMKAALSAAKERGVKLGSARENHWEGREDRRREGIRKGQPRAAKAAAEARSRKAQEAYSGLLPQIIKMREEEGLTLAEIAQRINAEGHKTRAGQAVYGHNDNPPAQAGGHNQPEPAARAPGRIFGPASICQGHNGQPGEAAQM